MLSVAPLLGVTAQEVKEPLWTSPEETAYVSVSGSGDLVAVVTTSFELLVYDGSGNLLWRYGGSLSGIEVTDVEVSYDGNVVVATVYNYTDYMLYVAFWKNAGSLSGTPSPDWVGGPLLGYGEAKCIAVSRNGNNVVVFDDSGSVYYWNDTLGLSGTVPPTWSYSPTSPPIISEYDVGISDDGDTVIVYLYL